MKVPPRTPAFGERFPLAASHFGRLSVLVAVLAVASGWSYAANGRMLEWSAWAAFSVSVATGHWDPCFFRNELVSGLFMKVHAARLGSDPPRVAPTAVRELAKEDYSWEALREASENWREPVIVRGLFSDVAAVSKWPLAGSSGLAPLAGFNVSVVQNSTMGKDHWINCGGHPNVDAVMEPFGAAFSDIERYDPNSTGLVAKTIVVPPASRSDRVRDPALDDALSTVSQ